MEYSASSSLLFAIEANYAIKKVTLENKSWQRDSELHHSGIAIGDIPIDGSFFELVAKIGCHIPLIDDQASIKFVAGPAISLQRRYLSRVRASTQYDYDPEHGPYEFDFLGCESEGTIPNLSIDGIMGVIISYKDFGIEARYARSFSERTCIRGLTINGKLDTFCILLRYSF